MHKGTFDIRQHLQLVLELLANVMRLPEWGRSVHDHIDLDEVVLSTSQPSMCTGPTSVIQVHSASSVNRSPGQQTPTKLTW
jgi:hypothetical protein